MSEQASAPETGAADTGISADDLWRYLLLYTLARLALIAVITVALALVDVPLLVALAVGIIVAFPLSLVLFRGLRNKTTVALAARNSRRDAERERLRAELRGEQ